jgi:hypothetical protein
MNQKMKKYSSFTNILLTIFVLKSIFFKLKVYQIDISFSTRQFQPQGLVGTFVKLLLFHDLNIGLMIKIKTWEGEQVGQCPKAQGHPQNCGRIQRNEYQHFQIVSHNISYFGS